MFKFECEKTSAWDALLDPPSLSDGEFLAQAYEQQFSRSVDANGIGYFGGQLAQRVDRRSVLLDITSSPERLFVVARRLGL